MRNIYRIFSINALFEQAKRIRLNLIILFFISIIMLIGFIAMAKLSGLSLTNSARDIQQYYNLPIFTSLMSRVIIWIWIASSIICFFTFILIKHNKKNNHFSNYMLFSAFLILFLAFDDAFLIHEVIFPYYFGISDNIYMVGLIFIFFIFLYFFILEILETDYIFLILFCVCFCFSLSIDIIFDNSTAIKERTFVEDSFKFIGVLMWLNYNIRTGLNLVQKCYQ